MKCRKDGTNRGKPEKSPHDKFRLSPFHDPSGVSVVSLHENITHDKVEQLVFRRLDDRLNKGSPGKIKFRMRLHKFLKGKNVFVFIFHKINLL
jgi:hypothetical protein